MGNSAKTPQNYSVLGQAPLDAKVLVTSKANLISEFTANPLPSALTYYKGMIVYLAEEESFFIWERPFSPFFKHHKKLLDENFIYPQDATYDGISYGNEAYNFIEFTYRKEYIGSWDVSEKLIDIVVYGAGTQTPFTQNQITNLWPNASKVSFVSGDLTGIKLFGQNVDFYQPINLSDWNSLVYEVWDTDPSFLQEVRILVMEAGDNIDQFLYQSQVIGNAFKEIKIITHTNQIRFKNSLYLRKSGLNFEMFVTDNNGVARQIGTSGGGGGSVTVDWGDISNIPTTFTPSPHTHDWNSIENKPSTFPPSAHGHDWNDISNKPSFFSGDYNDLSNIPSAFPPSSHSHTWSDISGKPNFHAVATSGNYNDLENKPTLFSGNYSDLSGIPSSFTPSAHLHTWADISGKPNFHVVATSGSYNDLSNKPTIPAAQVQPNWTATSGMGMILNKPTTFAPSAHTHTMSDVTGLINELTFKVNYSEVGQPDGVASLGSDGKLAMSQRPPLPAHSHPHVEIENNEGGNAFSDQMELDNQNITLDRTYHLRKIFVSNYNEIFFDIDNMDDEFECMFIGTTSCFTVFVEDKEVGITFMLNGGLNSLNGEGSVIVIRRKGTTQFVVKGDLS